ncbi:MAG: TonB-dependent receptor [Opitutaceae bacterium]|jgi:vitamin B12 transporter|nr:TonB-dependent receptor [Opitutaceae bacterium]
MTSTHSLFRRAERLFAIALAGLAANAITAGALAQASASAGSPDETVRLDRYVVSAARAPQDLKTTPSSVTVISLLEMRRSQITDLREALQTAPGVNVVETGGALGSQTSVNIRGASAPHTLFLLDGIRINSEDPTNRYASIFGAGGLTGAGRVEVLRGAQSILYGSSAIGGVITLDTTRGDGALTGALGVEGGVFATVSGAASASGSVDLRSAGGGWGPAPLHYSLALSALSTENDRSHNDFKQIAFATRLECDILPNLFAGVTYRSAHNDYDEPGTLHDPSTAGHANQRFDLVTLYAGWRPIEALASRLTLGFVNSDYDWDRTAFPSTMTATRKVIDWQNTWQAVEWVQVVAGLNAEWSRYDNASLILKDNVRSAYLSANAAPVKNLDVTLGVRADDYDTLDAHVTWRAGVAYRVEQTATTLRANYGTGYNAPSPNYVLGGGWYEPSPSLKPEKSKGWDAGFEQDLWDNRITVGAAWFRNDFENKFDAAWNVFGYRYNNIPGATTKGVEVSLAARPHSQVGVRAAYTHLNARDDSGARLIRQPRNILTGDVNYQATPEWLVGLGVSWVADRPDDTYFDASFAQYQQSMGDYALVRFYTSYEIRPGLTLRARAENLCDKEYQTVADYPGLPLGVFAGIEWKF